MGIGAEERLGPLINYVDDSSILTPGQALRQGVELIECPFRILIANALD